MSQVQREFPYQIVAWRNERGVQVTAYGGTPSDHAVTMHAWPMGWTVEVTHRSGGYLAAEGLPDRLDAIDALTRELLLNGGTGFIPLVSTMQRPEQ